MSTLAIPLRKNRGAAAWAASVGFPLLEIGYHLIRPEFHQRCEPMLPDSGSQRFNFELGQAESIMSSRSGFISGLWLDVAAMVAGDLKRIAVAVLRGLAPADHANFAKQLSAAK